MDDDEQIDWDLDNESGDEEWNEGDAEHQHMHFLSDDENESENEAMDSTDSKPRASIHRNEATSKQSRAMNTTRAFLLIISGTLGILINSPDGFLEERFASTTTSENESLGKAIRSKCHAGAELLDVFQDCDSPEIIQRLCEVTDDDLSWFGGVLPRHPMFFSGWKGNPFLFTKKHLHWTNTPVLCGINYPPKDNSDNDNQFKTLYEGWRKKLKALFNICKVRAKLVADGIGILSEIMAKCNMAAIAPLDWWPDWASSSRLAVAKSVSESSGLDELDPNDPVIAILQHSTSLDFFLTTPGHPYQWAHSASDAYHHQCARYMVLGEQEPVTFFHLSQTESPPDDSRLFATMAQEPNFSKPWTVHLQRPLTCMSRHLMRCGANAVSDGRSAAQRMEWGQLGIGFAPDVFPYTKYLSRPDDDMVTPKDERLMSLPAEVVSMDMAFGFLAIGFDDGILAAFCVEKGLPHLILYETASNRNDMFNSVHISRRIVRKVGSDDMTDEDKPFEHEYTLLVTRNMGAVDVHVLSKHQLQEREKENSTVVCPNHDLATKCTKSLDGFISPPNDARLSPDGRFLACVGDDGGVWIAPMTYSSSEDKDANAIEEFDATLPIRQFGAFQKLDLGYLFAPMTDPPIAISDATRVTGRRHRQRDVLSLTMQYMSWSCGSRYFAASSDSFPWVLIFDVENEGRVVCRLDAGNPTFAVAFHPTNPYVLAFSNRMGYVHIVDLTEYLKNPLKETSMSTQPPFIYPPRQILRHDYQVPGTGGTTSTGGRFLQESFSGIVAKINGILWSDDGQRLYVATNRRVLMHTVADRTEAPSLLECVSRKVWDGGLVDLEEKDAEAAEVLKGWAQDLLASKKWAGHWRY
ncbi:hypothetical protein BDR26DRAFT_858277 [Obelidium mucronatum]|nr:hypothetical protein BDR26DRAFT_858277 [Obelidium mucronatum]